MIKRTVVAMISIAQPIGAVAPLERSIALSDTQSVLKMLERRYITDFEMKQYIGQANARVVVEQHALSAGYSRADLAVALKGTLLLSLGVCGVTVGALLSELSAIAHLTGRLQIVSFLSGGILGLQGLGFLWKAVSKKSRVENLIRAYAVKQMLLQARTMPSSQRPFIIPAVADNSCQVGDQAVVSVREVAQENSVVDRYLAL